VTEAPVEGDAKGHREREGREEGPKRQGEAGGCRSAFKGVSLTRSAGGWAGCRKRSPGRILQGSKHCTSRLLMPSPLAHPTSLSGRCPSGQIGFSTWIVEQGSVARDDDAGSSHLRFLFWDLLRAWLAVGTVGKLLTPSHCPCSRSQDQVAGTSLIGGRVAHAPRSLRRLICSCIADDIPSTCPKLVLTRGTSPRV
jgi:hypothetical protein